MPRAPGDPGRERGLRGGLRAGVPSERHQRSLHCRGSLCVKQHKKKQKTKKRSSGSFVGGWGTEPPHFWMVLKPPGPAQAPKGDDYFARFCIQGLRVHNIVFWEKSLATITAAVTTTKSTFKIEDPSLGPGRVDFTVPDKSFCFECAPGS